MTMASGWVRGLGVALSLAMSPALAAEAQEEVVAIPGSENWITEDSLDHLLVEGCIEGPPMLPGSPAFSTLPLSSSSIRFRIIPDSFRGDGAFFATLDSGSSPRAAPDGQPFVLITVGNWTQTCTLRMPMADCAPAPAVLAELKALQIPINTGMDLGMRFTLHATGYEIEFVGDISERNSLRFAGEANPLQAPLDAAREALRECWQPALDAVREATQRSARDGSAKP